LETINKEHLQKNLRQQDAETYRFESPVESPVLPPEPVRQEPMRLTDYITIINATSDVETSGSKDIYTFFMKFNEFLKKPYWSFGHRQLSKNKTDITMADVIDAVGVKSELALPSIRFPGTLSFFRAVDLKEMTIITWRLLQTLRLGTLLTQEYISTRKKIQDKKVELKELVDRESSIVIATAAQQEEDLSKQITLLEEQAKKMLTKKTSYNINIPIETGIKYVQVFPLDLSDCRIDIQGAEKHRFISKIPGQAQHFIGTITYTSQKTTLDEAIIDFVKNCFIDIFTGRLSPATSNKCWFINTLDITVKSTLYTIKKLVVYMEPGISKPYTGSFVYIDGEGKPKKWYDGNMSDISRQDFIDTIAQWKNQSMPSYRALFEATGGNEISYTPERKE
jgi:hypothetical protein